MTIATFILRSLRFYWRTHLGVLAGVAVTAAILTGSLVVGDSVRFTLKQLALARLGRPPRREKGQALLRREGGARRRGERLRALQGSVDGGHVLAL